MPTQLIWPPCDCNQCYHTGPSEHSKADCPFAKAWHQREHERELEADEARYERREAGR